MNEEQRYSGNYFMAESFEQWFERKYHLSFKEYGNYDTWQKDYYRKRYEEDMKFAQRAVGDRDGEFSYEEEFPMAGMTEEEYEVASHCRFPFAMLACAAVIPIVIAMLNVPFIHLHYRPEIPEVQRPEIFEDNESKDAEPSETAGDNDGDNEGIAITEEVEYWGLEPGTEYEITGTLVDKKTGDPIKDNDGNNISSSTKFVAESGNGSEEIKYLVYGYIWKTEDVAYSIIGIIKMLLHGGPEKEVVNITFFK